MNQNGHLGTRAAVALALLCVIHFPIHLFADDDVDHGAEILGRKIAEKFFADFFGEHSPEHDLFAATAKKEGTYHFPADGQVISFYDEKHAVKVSTTLGRVMSLDLRGTGGGRSCSADDERALAPEPGHYLADVRRFLDATAPDVALNALTPQPHETLCWGGHSISSRTWSGLPDEDGVLFESTRVEVKFDLFTREVLGFSVQTMHWDDAIVINAADCRKIVTSEYGDRPGLTISRLALIRVFPVDGPAYPAWIATIETDPSARQGFIMGSGVIGASIHALTGEFIDDLKEYRADRPTPVR